MRAINIPEPEYFRYRRALAEQISQLTSGQCATGPFKGMWVHPEPAWDDGNLTTKLIGSYEHELHDAVEEAIIRNPKNIVNIGCAEGYYTIGMARRLLSAEIQAYDLDKNSLRLCAATAWKNGVSERVIPREGCKELPEIQGHSLIIMDCEGDEIHLLDEHKYPRLKACDILVECHDFMNASIGQRLVSRFTESHEIQQIIPRAPKIQDYSFLHSLNIGSQLEAITELRPDETIWLWMRYK